MQGIESDGGRLHFWDLKGYFTVVYVQWGWFLFKCTGSILHYIYCRHNWILQLLSTQSLINAAHVIKTYWETQCCLSYRFSMGTGNHCKGISVILLSALLTLICLSVHVGLLLTIVSLPVLHWHPHTCLFKPYFKFIIIIDNTKIIWYS